MGKSFIDFFRDGGIMLAGSISYFVMMALVPFCLFLVAIFGSVLGYYPGFYKFLSNKLITFFPTITSGITGELGKLITFRDIGTLSIILYGVLSYQVFSALENALNLIFKIQKMRSIFRSFILSFGVVTLIIIMILFSFTASSFIPLLKALKPIFPELRIGMITSFLIAYVVPFFMVLFTITMLYILLPKTRVRLPHALIGALFATSLQEVAKHLFTWYVGSFVKFGTIYGSLTTFVVFLLWVYYSTCIFLIGAEIVHNQETGRRGYGG